MGSVRHVLRHAARSARALLVVALIGCLESFGSDAISGARPFEPPQTYRSMWAEVEVCAGRTGDFERVRWYQVEGRGSFEYQGQSNLGYWWPSHDIVIAGHRVDNGRIVRHEMLHDLLNDPGHPSEYFVTRCGSIVR